MHEPPQIAERIKELIRMKNIGTLDMLKNCGLSKNALTSMVNGSMPKADSLAKIANYLGVSTDYLLGIDEETKKIPSSLAPDQQEILQLWDKLDPIKQAEFKGEIKGYLKAKSEIGD